MILRPPEQDYAERPRAMSPARAIAHGLLDAAIAMMFTFALVVAVFLLMGCFAEDEALGGGVEGGVEGGGSGGESSGGASVSSTSAASASGSSAGSGSESSGSGGTGSETSGSTEGTSESSPDAGGTGADGSCDPTDPQPGCTCLVEGENTACAPSCLKGSCPMEGGECIDVEPGEGETLACVLPCDPMGLCPDGMACIGWDDGDVGAMICMWPGGGGG